MKFLLLGHPQLHTDGGWILMIVETEARGVCEGSESRLIDVALQVISENVGERPEDVSKLLGRDARRIFCEYIKWRERPKRLIVKVSL